MVASVFPRWILVTDEGGQSVGWQTSPSTYIPHLDICTDKEMIAKMEQDIELFAAAMQIPYNPDGYDKYNSILMPYPNLYETNLFDTDIIEELP